MGNLRTCQHCKILYDWTKSPSGLKMTFCSHLCEKGELGFTIEGILKWERQPSLTEEEKETLEKIGRRSGPG